MLQLLYIPQPPGQGGDLPWSTYVWRRGTVPIWWGVEIKSGGVGEASIVVSNAKPYRGTKRSVERSTLMSLCPKQNLCSQADLIASAFILPHTYSRTCADAHS